MEQNYVTVTLCIVVFLVKYDDRKNACNWWVVLLTNYDRWADEHAFTEAMVHKTVSYEKVSVMNIWYLC